MKTILPFFLLAVVWGILGCGSVKRMAPDTDFWRDEVPTTVARTPAARPALRAPMASPATPAPFAVADLDVPPDGPSAADRAAQASRATRSGDPDRGALRAAWKELKARHVPARVLEMALQQRFEEVGLSFPMPAPPETMDVYTTGGLAGFLALILAVLLGRRKRGSYLRKDSN